MIVPDISKGFEFQQKAIYSSIARHPEERINDYAHMTQI
jgi:hypothetical protein